MKARDVMTIAPAAVTPSAKISEAAEIMRYQEVGCLPVVSDVVSPRLVGIITDRDISVRCTARRHGVVCHVADHMTPIPLQTVTEDADVDEIAAKMEAARVRRIPVVDAQGTVVGIVSEADLVANVPEHEAISLHRHVRAALRPRVARVSMLSKLALPNEPTVARPNILFAKPSQ